MSSSSSDSDSDDYEPIRRIKINIKPKSSVDNAKSTAATIQELKASVESWRPLGPLPHPSLSRRQSSLSSVSSMSMYGLHSSPSCSSLVNEFNNRSAFSNILSASRTSSPLTVINHGDSVPLAVAIQESIELLIKGTTRHTKRTTTSAQNSNSGLAANQAGTSEQIIPRESMFPAQEEINFNKNGLNHDTQLYNLGNQDYDANFVPEFTSRSMGNLKLAFPNAFAKGAYGKPAEPLRFRLNSTENIIKYYASRLIKDNSRVFELDMDLLMSHLRKLNEQSPASSYYNVDVLRYQIAPINVINRCPIQVCAYWGLEPELIKLRIDFKHSNQSGIPLDRLREISISVNLNDLLSSAKHSNGDNCSPLNCKNNNSIDTKNMNELYPSNERGNNLPSSLQSSHILREPGQPTTDHFKIIHDVISKPQAHWNHSIKQLTWKFNSLESYQNSDGLGSLFAKIYHRRPTVNGAPSDLVPYPNPVDIKFLVVDSTLSKVGFTVDSAGYKMALLKREIRSGRYRCEPFLII